MVDNDHVKWDMPLDYNPPYYTWEECPYPKRGVDPKLTAENFEAFKFNEKDVFDRLSHHGPYELLDGVFSRCALVYGN